MKHAIEATLTNIWYILAGIFLYQYSGALFNMLWAGTALGLLSGLHHWNYGLPERKLPVNWTRYGDYFGMYMVLINLILLALGIYDIWGLIVSIIGAAFLVGILRGNPAGIGVGIGTLLILLYVKSGGGPVMECSAFLGIAYTFNYIGDNLHKQDHSPLHGLGWHIPTAYVIYLGGVYLVAAL